MKNLIHHLRWKLLQFLEWLFYKIEWYFSEERNDPYRCEECGSIDVEIKIWSKINAGGQYAGDCEEYDHCYCHNCDKQVRIKSTSYLMASIEEWWESLDFSQTMCRTFKLPGYCKPLFLEQACQIYWSELSDEEKIKLYFKQDS